MSINGFETKILTSKCESKCFFLRSAASWHDTPPKIFEKEHVCLHIVHYQNVFVVVTTSMLSRVACIFISLFLLKRYYNLYNTMSWFDFFNHNDYIKHIFALQLGRYAYKYRDVYRRCVYSYNQITASFCYQTKIK